MAILPTGRSFVSHTGTILTPQEESAPLEILNGAINSLRNGSPAQANEFVKRLQQVNPATVDRIFHLTWERSGKPMHLGDRFGEEAFFGCWRHSIDPTTKLEILNQVLQEKAAINAQAPSAFESQTAPLSQKQSHDANPLYITELAFAIFSHCDLQTLGRLARVNQVLKVCVKDYEEQVDLKRFCPNLRILNAEAQEITINDEPSVSKGWILKNYTELKHHVQYGEGLTLLTMPQGLTLNRLIAIAADKGQIVDVITNQVVQEYGDVPVERTYVILITNNVFQQSRNKSYAQQQELVAGHRCVMPTVQEYVALCVFTNKVFQKCLYREGPDREKFWMYQDLWNYGSTSMQIDGYPVVVGGSTPTKLLVSCSEFNNENVGAGGQRRFWDMQA